MDEWRTICSCQQHRPRNAVLALVSSGASSTLRRIRTLRSPYAALVLSVPIVFGAAAMPGREVAHFGTTSAAVVPAALVPLQARTTVQDVSFATVPHQQLHLVTAQVRSRFLSERREPDEYTLSLVKAEFFRKRVPYGSLIYREALSNGLPPELVAAVVETESDFRRHLVSNRNAVGLMQVIPETGALMGGGDLHDPADNVRVGTRYLSYLYRQFGGDTKMVLAAYNAGETAVRRYGGVPPYTETRNYVRRVASRSAWYQRAFERRVGHLFAVPRVDVPVAQLR